MCTYQPYTSCKCLFFPVQWARHGRGWKESSFPDQKTFPSQRLLQSVLFILQWARDFRRSQPAHGRPCPRRLDCDPLTQDRDREYGFLIQCVDLQRSTRGDETGQLKSETHAVTSQLLRHPTLLSTPTPPPQNCHTTTHVMSEHIFECRGDICMFPFFAEQMSCVLQAKNRVPHLASAVLD